MVLVKINTPVHYHVKKIEFNKKICQGPVSFFDGNMVVSAGMAHMIGELFPKYQSGAKVLIILIFRSVILFHGL